MRAPLPALALAILAGPVAACAPAPAELSGLWARGEGGCEAGAGILFARDAVRLQIAGESQVLLDAPRYEIRARGTDLHVTIAYEAPGSVRRAGELELERGPDGWLRLTSHRHPDAATGSARARLPDVDPLARALRVRRCGEPVQNDGLRDRT